MTLKYEAEYEGKHYTATLTVNGIPIYYLQIFCEGKRVFQMYYNSDKPAIAKLNRFIKGMKWRIMLG